MIEIVPYDERWPAEFAAIGAALRSALGDLALRIDHIGSTAVPGLAAKDLVDVQVTVRSLEPLAPILAALEGIGYTMREGIARDHAPPGSVTTDAEWQKRLFKPPAGQRPTNLHVRVQGRANQRYALLFRDYLRANPASAAAYAEVKRQLARYHADDTSAYVTIKDPVCDIIMVAAEAWAATVGWQLGPSDV
jgi:GrpB-like predicted nucleotidyltransferase (UPF0157 family)